jgi:hypothetical protein
MSGTTSGAQCNRKTTSPDGMCPQHQNAPLPLKPVRSNQYLKMPPPKVADTNINDPDFHAQKVLKVAVHGLGSSVNRGDITFAAIGLVAVGITSAQTYFEASQKFGWTFTKANRNLRHLNASIPSLLEEGGIGLNKNFWKELDDNKYEAQNDRSYLIEPTSDRFTHVTVSLHRTGMEEDRKNAKSSGKRKAAKTYKDFSKVLIGLLYEDDPAAAANKMADDLEGFELPADGQVLINRFKIPYYQPAATAEVLEARANIASRYREIASSLRNPPSESKAPFIDNEAPVITRTKTKSGTIFRIN